MKNFVLLLIIVLSSVSCSSDDSEQDNVQPNASIIGEWQLEEIFNGNENQNLDDCELLNTFEFFSNGTAIVQNYYTGTGGACMSQDPSQYQFTVSENTLTLTIGNDVFTEQIDLLTEENLIILVDERYNGPLSGNIFTVKYKRLD